MILATWNLNHQVGTRPFRSDAAHAAIQLQADLVVFTEYFPRNYHEQFCEVLSSAGLPHHWLSKETPERANRVFIVSRFALEPVDVALPSFDFQFPANIAAIRLRSTGLRVLGVRVPAYQSEQQQHVTWSWDWLESTAAAWSDGPAVILGDLNVKITSPKRAGGEHFRRIMNAGWTRLQPAGDFSYYGLNGRRSEIDQALTTSRHILHRQSRYLAATQDYVLAGQPGSLSDHAALVADVEVV